MKIKRPHHHIVPQSIRQVLFASLAALCLTSLAFAQRPEFLFINANVGLCSVCQPNKNQVLVYSLNTETGQLSHILGPFFTGGTGVYKNPPGNEVRADQQLIVNAEGTLLFAVNGDSNSIAVFNINSDGTLTAVSGSPFASNGPQPASLGLLEDPNIGNGNSILVVANKDDDPLQPQTGPNLSTFLVSPSGTLTLNTGATVTLPRGSSPSQALIEGGQLAGDLLLGMQYIGTGGHGSLTSYLIGLDGSLSAQNTVTPPNSGKFFLGEVEIDQAVYVGLPDQDMIGIYHFGSEGTILFNYTITASGTKPGWLTANKRRTRLYASDTGSNSIVVYKTQNIFFPTQLQSFALSSGSSLGPTKLALDATESYLFVLAGTTLHTLTLQTDGTLAETIPAHLLPVAAGTVPTGMATLLK